MLIGAVVLNFRTPDDTVKTVRALLAQQEVGMVVVVDNASGGEDVTTLQRGLGSSEGVTIHIAERNLGYSGGNNLGLRLLLQAGVTHALVLNPDVHVPSGVILQLCKESRDGVVLACPVLVRADGSVDSNGGWWAYRWGRGELERRHHVAESTRPGRLRTFAGACFVVDLAMFNDLGLLPEEHFLYGEEADVVMRINERGLRWLMVSATVLHERGGSVGSSSEWGQKSLIAHRYAAQSAIALTRRHWAHWLPVAVAARAGLVLRALMSGDGASARAIARGIADGLRAS